MTDVQSIAVSGQPSRGGENQLESAWGGDGRAAGKFERGMLGSCGSVFAFVTTARGAANMQHL